MKASIKYGTTYSHAHPTHIPTKEFVMSSIESEVVSALKAHLAKNKVSSAAPADTPAAVCVAAPRVAAADEVMFSTVFGYTPTTGDYPIRVRPLSGNAEIDRLIPRVDADYVVQKDEAAILVAGIMDGDKTMMTGPTGSGKSSLVKYVCAKLNAPFIRINMSGDVESAALFGSLVVEDGATKWRDGAITEACKMGAVCLVDEWELMPAEIAMGMQNLLEDDGYLYLKEKPGTSEDRTTIPAKGFTLVFAGNSVGQGDTTGAFNGVGVQNTATIDRFTNTVKLDYLSAAHEVAIITGKTNVSKDVATKMVKLAHLVRAAYTSGKLGLTMSPRTLINWGRKMERYTPAMALGVAFLDKMLEDDKVSVNELFVKVFGA
jgi:MoxR-like ATPase